MNRLILPLALLMLALGGAVIALSQRPWAPRSDVVQPIPFSHRIHAGVNKIPCQYCHYSAGVSNEPGIPSMQTCMACHYLMVNGSTPLAVPGALNSSGNGFTDTWQAS